jgi:hypothetical protein
MILLKRKTGQSPRGTKLPTRARFPKILAIDPGTTESAFIWYDTFNGAIGSFAKVLNAKLLLELLKMPTRVVCEQIKSYGMPVGDTTFDTVRFTGRIEQICRDNNIPFILIPRVAVKNALKPLPRRNDKDIRGSLIQLYGQPGTKNSPGPTYGITKDVWASLGVAHAYRKRLLHEPIIQGTD